MRLNPAVNMHINAFSGATITELDSGMTNAVMELRNDIPYITQRPSIDVFEDASTHVSDNRGRAIYYWALATSLYIFNNDTIYKGSQSTSLSTAPTAGTKKAKFLELGTNLILINPESDEAFTITTGGTVTEITDTDFPPKQTPAIPLAWGGAILDKYLFVLGTNGTIYSSTLSTPATWGALDFKEAEREPDGGVAIGKHYDNIVVYGTATIEFFYDAANSSGSPINRRQDVSYNVGMNNGESLWEEGDRSFFIGRNFSGALGVYTLENFQIRKLSTTTIDSFLTQAIAKDNYLAVGSGMSAQGHIYYTLTLYHVSTDIVPDITLVYDDTAGLWCEWETTVNSLTKFPVVDWTKRLGASTRYGEGILANGDLVTINDNLTPADTLLSAGWVETAWVETGWVSRTPGSAGTAVAVKSRLGQSDLGSTLHKYPLSYKVVADLTPNSQTLTLKWANENNTSFNTGKTFDTSKYQKATRNGRFRRRNHEIQYSGSDVLRLEAIEADIPTGDN